MDFDTVSICVPTPLRKTRDPDLSHVLQAAEQLAAHLRKGTLVVLESTTYPGTTEEVILPMLQGSGLKVGEDFFLCYSPERVDPGNRDYHTRNIPKVIGGVTPSCTRIGELFYSQFMDRVVPVSTTRVAEMVKLLENTFRMINIGLANEMALMCDHMGIDVWEVIGAAATVLRLSVKGRVTCRLTIPARRPDSSFPPSIFGSVLRRAKCTARFVIPMARFWRSYRRLAAGGFFLCEPCRGSLPETS